MYFPHVQTLRRHLQDIVGSQCRPRSIVQRRLFGGHCEGCSTIIVSFITWLDKLGVCTVHVSDTVCSLGEPFSRIHFIRGEAGSFPAARIS